MAVYCTVRGRGAQSDLSYIGGVVHARSVAAGRAGSGFRRYIQQAAPRSAPRRHPSRSLISARAWSHEVKKGEAHGVRTESGCVLRSRTAARIGRCNCMRTLSTASRSVAATTAEPMTAPAAAPTFPISARASTQRGRAYPCREEAGLIFVLTGDPLLTDIAKFPQLGSASDRAYKTRAASAAR